MRKRDTAPGRAALAAKLKAQRAEREKEKREEDRRFAEAEHKHAIRRIDADPDCWQLN